MAAADETGTKLRTWWHPLLARLLEHALGDACEVREEVSVGTLPLRADILLIRRDRTDFSDEARRELPSLTARLNQQDKIPLADDD